MSETCIVTIRNNSPPYTRESRVYGTHSLAKKYMASQAEIYDVKWNGTNTLIAGGNTITCTPTDLQSLIKNPIQNPDKSCCVIL
jgi:hypothetical protein